MRYALLASILLNLASWAAYAIQHRDVGALMAETRELVNGNVRAGATASGVLTMVAISWGLALIALAIAFLAGLRERQWPRTLVALACAVQAAPLAWFYIASH